MDGLMVQVAIRIHMSTMMTLLIGSLIWSKIKSGKNASKLMTSKIGLSFWRCYRSKHLDRFVQHNILLVLQLS